MSVLQKFIDDKIVEILSLAEAPEQLLQISYPSGVSVNGVELKPVQVKDEPKVEWDEEAGTYYTLLMTDPDAPAPFGEVRHWLVVNIAGNNLHSGEAKIAFLGSGPPEGYGIHRYVFLLFKQPNGKQEFDSLTTTKPSTKRLREGRLATNTHQLIADYNLELVAGKFYYAQYDDSVPRAPPNCHFSRCVYHV